MVYISKTIGYIRLRLYVIYGIYSANTMGYIGQTLWDIFFDILVKNCRITFGIYWSIGYINQKQRDILGKIMGYILKNYGIY